MDAKQVLNNILKDTQVKLSSEFDLNFQHRAFFDQKWKSSKYGMQKSGNLRRSIASQIEGRNNPLVEFPTLCLHT